MLLNTVSAKHTSLRGSQSVGTTAVDTWVTRVVALALLAVPAVAIWYIATQVMHSAPSAATQEIASLDPRSLFSSFSSDQSDFLPTPVAALPPEKNAGPPAPQSNDTNVSSATPAEQVKVVNTGGIGAVMRADPPRGRQVAALREGQVLQVIEHQNVGGDDWVHVRTPDGTDGWVYGRLVGPVQ
jgi:hypothetical protein